jgi:hypothetical protein
LKREFRIYVLLWFVFRMLSRGRIKDWIKIIYFSYAGEDYGQQGLVINER